jgi:hypothetical protein
LDDKVGLGDFEGLEDGCLDLLGFGLIVGEPEGANSKDIAEGGFVMEPSKSK